MTVKAEVVLVPDTHGDAVDEPAFRAFMNRMKKREPRWCLHMGDLVDAYPLSRFTKRALSLMNQRAVDREFASARMVLKKMVELAPTWYLPGNHEYRLTSRLEECEGLHLYVGQSPWEAIAERCEVTFVKAGFLREEIGGRPFYFTHGKTSGLYGGYAAARRASRSCYIQAHTHKMGQVFTKGGLYGAEVGHFVIPSHPCFSYYPDAADEIETGWTRGGGWIDRKGHLHLEPD